MIIFSSNFFNTKISHIVAFDAFLETFTRQWLCKNLFKTTLFKKSTPFYESLNKDIYDLEYVNSNVQSILKLIFEFKFEELKENRIITIEEYNYFSSYCNDIIKVYVIFDKCGICSVRFDFIVKKSINTDDLIELTEKSCCLVDGDVGANDLFSVIKNDLKKTDIKTILLKEPMTYTIISSIKEGSDSYPLNYPKNEIFGVSWKYTNYMMVSNTIINDVCSNNIPLFTDDILLVTRQSTLMVFPGDPEDSDLKDYVENRIIAIELFWRQKFLLRKLDYQITDLLEYIKKEETGGNLKSLIKKIKDTQISMHSDLETYRNTILSVNNMFVILFRTLNKIFEVETHFNFVQSKLSTCDSIYKGLHDERRNNLMERLQYIVIVLGSINVFYLLLTENMGINYLLSQNNLIFLSSSLLIIIILCLYLRFKK